MARDVSLGALRGIWGCVELLGTARNRVSILTANRCFSSPLRSTWLSEVEEKRLIPNRHNLFEPIDDSLPIATFSNSLFCLSLLLCRGGEGG